MCEDVKANGHVTGSSAGVSLHRSRCDALVDRVRSACAEVAGSAAHVEIVERRLPAYAAGLRAPGPAPGLDPSAHFFDGSLERRAASYLCLDAINFGSGWWPTIRKRSGMSGYFTIATSLRDRWLASGGWPASQLADIGAHEIAAVTGQDSDHPLMELYASSLRDLGARVRDEFAGRFLDLVEGSGRSAVALTETLSGWHAFADVSRHHGKEVPFFKRAQLAAADLHLAEVVRFYDLARLTAFADNVVPHVLRVDGVLRLSPELERRIDSGRLLEHGSPEEVELRACALHAIELIVRELDRALCSQEIDNRLWNRGRAPRYKAIPRPRARTTAY